MTDTCHPGPGDRPRAAVIGGGVSGLTAAYVLQGTHEVTLFEADERVGGHAHTHDVTLSDGSTAAVDSGFIVLNDRTYPLLRRLLGELGVQTRPTEMSMSISCSGCGLTFVGGRGADGIFAQRRRILDPRFWRLLLSVRRFQKAALALLSEEPASEISYGQFLDQRGFDAHFVTHYALPVVSCVWSMGDQEALDYPAAHLFAFLRRRGLGGGIGLLSGGRTDSRGGERRERLGGEVGDPATATTISGTAARPPLPDSSKGSIPRTVQHGVGLANLADRVTAVGGHTLQRTARSGHGKRITGHIPSRPTSAVPTEADRHAHRRPPHGTRGRTRRVNVCGACRFASAACWWIRPPLRPLRQRPRARRR